MSESIWEHPIYETHLRMEILSKRYRSADDGTQIEDAPENANESALLALGSVRQHQGTLSCPEKACADSKDCTSRDDERSSVRMSIHCAKNRNL